MFQTVRHFRPTGMQPLGLRGHFRIQGGTRVAVFASPLRTGATTTTPGGCLALDFSDLEVAPWLISAGVRCLCFSELINGPLASGGIYSRTICESVADSARGCCGPLALCSGTGDHQLDICIAVAPRRGCEQCAWCEDRRGNPCELQLRKPHPDLPPLADRRRSRESLAGLRANPPPTQPWC